MKKPWFIGQRIVAIESHHQGPFKAGDEFVIKSLSHGFCGCSHVLIDIGFLAIHPESWCHICETVGPSSGIWWFSERRFAPIDEIEAQISELVEEAFVKEPFE